MDISSKIPVDFIGTGSWQTGFDIALDLEYYTALQREGKKDGKWHQIKMTTICTHFAFVQMISQGARQQRTCLCIPSAQSQIISTDVAKPLCA